MKRLIPAGIRVLAIAALGLLPVASLAQPAPPRVVADIAPVHSIVAQLMDGVAEPELLLKSGASPHDYSMKPSEARMLDEADIVVWTGPALTPWLEDATDVLAEGAVGVTFSELEGLTLLPFRTGALFEAHDHGHEDEQGHEQDHDHDHDHDHDSADGHAGDHEPEGHEDAQGIDPHVWLDPQNAEVLVSELARVLAERDPYNAERYNANAQRALDGLARLEADINAIVSPLRTSPFLVFHDAYHYFEARFDIHATAAVSLSDGVKPGAQRIRELQELIADQGVVCVFAEPQFEPKLLRRLTEGTDVRSGTLDPLGVDIDPGADHYGQLLRAMAGGLSECLTP